MDAERQLPDAPLWPELTPEEAATFDDETLVILERRCLAVRLRRSGKSLREIRAVLGCGLTTVHRDIQTVREGYEREAIRGYASNLAEAIARNRYLRADAAEQWEKSKGVRTETFTGRRAGGRAGGTDEARVKKTEQTGNPALLKALRDLDRDWAEMMGILKPEASRKADDLPPVKYVAGLDPAEVV